MSKQHESYRIYRALLYLYPRSHRKAYGEQMVQTLDDILSDQQTKRQRLLVWVRVGSELPLNIIEENIHNTGEITMGKLAKISNQQLLIIISAIVVVAVSVGLVLRHAHQYTPTKLTEVPRAAVLPDCLQKTDDASLKIDTQDQTYIVNAVITSIIDVPAGTNDDVHLKTYDGTTATGSSIYSGKYGSYNFTAKKTADNSTNNYVGGWTITHFEACR